MSATGGNCDQLEAAVRPQIPPQATRTFRLGAGRSQVQILSPRSSESPGNPGLLPVLATIISGHRVQYGVLFLHVTPIGAMKRPYGSGQIYEKWAPYAADGLLGIVAVPS